MVSRAEAAVRIGVCAVAAIVVVSWYGARSTLAGQSGAGAAGEWRDHGGDAGSTKYSPLDQINRDNVKDLRIAWRWKAENFGPLPDFRFQVTPLMVGGVLYQSGAGAAGEWRDHGGMRVLQSIHRLIDQPRVKDLRIAWRWKAENFGPLPDFRFQGHR